MSGMQMSETDCGTHEFNGRGETSQVAKAMTEISDRIRDVERAARNWGVEPDQLEGKFVAAMLAAMRAVGEIVSAGAGEAKAIVADAKDLAELEIEKLRKSNLAALMTIRQAEVAKEAVIVHVTKGLTERLVPELRDWLVLKQTGYNLRQAWRLGAIVSVCALMIGVGGYQLRAWEDGPQMAGVERCASRQMTGTLSGEEVSVCLLSDLAWRPENAGPEGFRKWFVSLFH